MNTIFIVAALAPALAACVPATPHYLVAAVRPCDPVARSALRHGHSRREGLSSPWPARLARAQPRGRRRSLASRALKLRGAADEHAAYAAPRSGGAALAWRLRELHARRGARALRSASPAPNSIKTS